MSGYGVGKSDAELFPTGPGKSIVDQPRPRRGWRTLPPRTQTGLRGRGPRHLKNPRRKAAAQWPAGFPAAPDQPSFGLRRQGLPAQTAQDGAGRPAAGRGGSGLRPKTIEANCGAAGPPHGGGRRRRAGRRRQSLEQGRPPPGLSLKDQLVEVWTARLKGRLRGGEQRTR
jgi:hypothetical protein